MEPKITQVNGQIVEVLDKDGKRIGDFMLSLIQEGLYIKINGVPEKLTKVIALPIVYRRGVGETVPNSYQQMEVHINE